MKFFANAKGNHYVVDLFISHLFKCLEDEDFTFSYSTTWAGPGCPIHVVLSDDRGEIAIEQSVGRVYDETDVESEAQRVAQVIRETL